MEVLDQEDKSNKIKIQRLKILNLVVILAAFLIILYAINSIINEYKTTVDNPWFSAEAWVLYNHGTGINFCLVLLIGLIPTLYFRLIKLYLISTLCMLSFTIIGFSIMHQVKFYEIFQDFIY